MSDLKDLEQLLEDLGRPKSVAPPKKNTRSSVVDLNELEALMDDLAEPTPSHAHAHAHTQVHMHKTAAPPAAAPASNPRASVTSYGGTPAVAKPRSTVVSTSFESDDLDSIMDALNGDSGGHSSLNVSVNVGGGGGAHHNHDHHDIGHHHNGNHHHAQDDFNEDYNENYQPAVHDDFDSDLDAILHQYGGAHTLDHEPHHAPQARLSVQPPAPKPAPAPVVHAAPPPAHRPVSSSGMMDELESLLDDLDDTSVSSSRASARLSIRPNPTPAAPAHTHAPAPANPRLSVQAPRAAAPVHTPAHNPSNSAVFGGNNARQHPHGNAMGSLLNFGANLQANGHAGGPQGGSNLSIGVSANARAPAAGGSNIGFGAKTNNSYNAPQAQNKPFVAQPNRPINNNNALDALLGDLQSQLHAVPDPSTPTANGTCAACGRGILGEVITAGGSRFHPEHFVCGNCQNPLGTGNYYEQDGVYHCERCYQELLCPRCGHCDEPILDRCVTAMGKKWHLDHFVCTQCLNPFKNGSFYERDGRAFCENCFAGAFAPRCGGCSQPISGPCINACGAAWHPEHFVCQYCQKAFTGSFYEFGGKPYCDLHYHQQTGSLCAGCGKAVAGKVVDALGKKWHPEHFVCAFCMNPLAAGAFTENSGKAYCKDCHGKLFG